MRRRSDPRVLLGAAVLALAAGAVAVVIAILALQRVL